MATIKGTKNNDKLKGTKKGDTILGYAGDDELLGKGGKDLLKGGKGNDALYGGGGNDKLYGDDGNDILFGGGGKDKLFGGSGNDKLDGGKGDDKLDGGSGINELTGGLGADKFYFKEVSRTTVTDAKLSEGDKLYISKQLLGLNPDDDTPITTVEDLITYRAAPSGGDIHIDLSGGLGDDDKQIILKNVDINDLAGMIILI